MIVRASINNQSVTARSESAAILLQMNSRELAAEIIATYERHGWKLRRILLRPETRAEIQGQTFSDTAIVDSDFDALWFARPSPEKREAWELRLLAEQRYALFEAFEADESEEDREEARREMENRMREQASRS
jgi:hypothetical protein